MIKLSNLINEIKIQGNINPQKVIDLWIKLINYYNRRSGIGNKKWEELMDIKWKYIPEWLTSKYQDVFKEIIPKLNKQQLNNLYIDLLKFQKENNISEIRIQGKITPEIVLQFWNELDNTGNIVKTKRLDLLHKYIIGAPNIRTSLDSLSSNQLQSLYKDLWDLKNKYGINK